MKRLCLTAFLLISSGVYLAAVSVDLYGAASVKADLKESEEKSAGLENADGGVKISVPCLDGRIYWNGDDFSYGVAFSSEKLNKVFPVQVKWGKLSVGGGLSKLNNPLLSSSISPFTSATSSINPVTATLSSSFNKPDTMFFQAGYKKKSARNVVVNCYYDPNGKMFSPFGNAALSSLASFSLPNKIKLSAECTFGTFFYDAMKSSSWYETAPFYHGGRQNSVIGQTLFSMNNFSSIFTGGFYGSPSGDLKAIFKTENKIKIAKSTVGVSALYNPSHNLMTLSGKLIDECVQGKISFQHQFRGGKKFPLFWKPGLAGFYQRNLTEDIDVFKVSAGLQFLCFITSVSISGQGEFDVVSPVASGAVESFCFTKGAVTMKNQWYFPAVQPGVKLSASFVPAADYSYWKISENFVLYLTFSENPVVSLQCGAAFNQKGGESAGAEFDISGTVKFSWKWLRCTGKVSVILTS